jgi:tRNA modification GTPase
MSLPHFGDERKTNLDPDRRSDHPADRCTVLTGTGRSAIAVIGLSGANAAAILRRCFDPATNAKLSAGQIRYGNWTGPEQTETPAESVVVTPISTKVGDSKRFEIHCHGGTAAIERIVGDLQACGVARTDNSAGFEVENLLIREAHSVLAQCLTERMAAIALDQVRGALANWAVGWIDEIRTRQQSNNSADLQRLRRETQEMIRRASIGTRLADPFRVVLIGPPNVGKSSLVNAIVGYDRSITFDQAGTTRDVLHADTVIDGIPVQLSDTAGIRASDETIEQKGVARARAAAAAADLVLAVTSPEQQALASDQWSDPDRIAANAVGLQNRLQVFNKSDLLQSGEFPPSTAIATNALTGAGIPELLQTIADHLGRSLPHPGQPVPINQRQADRIDKLVGASDRNQVLSILHRLVGETE